MKEMKINNQSDLTALIYSGRNYYPILPKKLEARLIPLNEIVSNQIVKNWNDNNPQTAQIIANKQQKILQGQ